MLCGFKLISFRGNSALHWVSIGYFGIRCFLFLVWKRYLTLTLLSRASKCQKHGAVRQGGKGAAQGRSGQPKGKPSELDLGGPHDPLNTLKRLLPLDGYVDSH